MRLTSNAKISSPVRKNRIDVTIGLSLDGPRKNVDLHVIHSFPSLKILLSDWLTGDPRSEVINLAFASAIARRTILKCFL